MSSEDEVFNFLYEKVFEPALRSPRASKALKSGVNLTMFRLKRLDAVGRVKYFWSAIEGTPNSIKFAERMKNEGVVRFEEVLEEFRVKFDDKWIRAARHK